MKDGRHDGALQLLTAQKLPSVSAPAKHINATLANFDYIIRNFLFA